MTSSQELINNLKSRLSEIEIAIEESEQIIKNAPQGYLKIAANRKPNQYYQVIDNKNKYLKANDENIFTLAQKCYLEKALRYLKQEEKSLKSILDTYQKFNIESIYESYSDNRKEIVKPLIIPDDDYAKMWLDIPYTKKLFSENDTSNHYTEKKERVRSKSEILIANKLFHNGIPYKYEAAIKVKNSLVGDTIHPDFTILNKRTRKVYYLEHLGKVDDIGYINDNYPRILTYERNGILLGEKLFITHETMSKPVDLRTLDMLINKFFT